MENLITLEQHRWELCKINSNRATLFKSVASRLTNPDAVARYKTVEARTGVPWWFIAVAHEREASQNWSLSLAQGDPWNRKSVHVPANRGPFKSWEDAAYDALVNCPPYAARNKDWSPGGALAMLEKYNGLGYWRKGIPSPYIWAGTNQYTRGKFVADGVFSGTTVDSQLGCAGLLKAMGVLDGKDRTSGPTSAAGIGAFFYGIAQYWHQHETAIIASGVVLAILIGAGVHIYRNRK